MQTAYKDLNIQFLPDNVVKELGNNIATTNSVIGHIPDLSNSLPTQMLSVENLFDSHTFIHTFL